MPDSLLADEPFARRVATRAKAMVGERYGWARIADSTAAVYSRAAGEAPAFVAGQTAAALEFGRPSIVVPEGNLLGV